MESVTVHIPADTVNYLQRLDYETAGLRVLHTHALNAGVPLKKRIEIRREFTERFEEFQLAKQEFWAQYEPKYPGASWRLDYANGNLYIEEGQHAEQSAAHRAV